MEEQRRRGSFSSFSNLASITKLKGLGRDVAGFKQMVEEDRGDKEESDVYRKNVRRRQQRGGVGGPPEEQLH